jgi:hypothetical protein
MQKSELSDMRKQEHALLSMLEDKKIEKVSIE